MIFVHARAGKTARALFYSKPKRDYRIIPPQM